MTSLATVYGRYFPIGAAVEPRTLVTQGDLLVAQVNSVVAENAMKWERIHPFVGNSAASYDFRAADAIVSFASSHGMSVRGHNLVWHQQCPAWVFQGADGAASREEILGRMRDHIAALLAHFRGEVYCWDVVNEALSDAGTWRVESPWFRLTGAEGGSGVPEYVVKAFEHAREADPAVKLFSMIMGSSPEASSRARTRSPRRSSRKGSWTGWASRGTGPFSDPTLSRSGRPSTASRPLDWRCKSRSWTSRRSARERLVDAGLPAELARRQADQYGALFKVFREEADAHHLSGVTFWGIADDHTWLDDFPVKGRKDWPLLFDTHQHPKSAFSTVAQW